MAILTKEPTNQDIVVAIFDDEGGATFTDNPQDRGGPTRWGVTQATLARYRGRTVTSDDVRNLGPDEAAAICEREFIAGPGYDRIDNGWLRWVVVDAAYNSGPGNATRWLQSVLGVQPDGVIGAKTVEAIAASDRVRTARRFLAARLRFLGEIARANQEFTRGWDNRLADQIESLA